MGSYVTDKLAASWPTAFYVENDTIKIVLT
jgi:hypothetical protein